MDADNRRALDERQRQMEQRAAALADQAVDAGAPWLRDIGPRPTGPADASQWMNEVTAIAAYRDRYGITSSSPLGPPRVNNAQRSDRARAQVALRQAVAIARDGETLSRFTAPATEPGMGR